ncbi:TAXI family TRAP transporter solute-binding subunit [Murdochiella massiliensis]|uniref:TAXI family TRAP transporter solute-binding subunit n=1 Tax=Murdochiella massiliensis TaxID=1673723 RepID=UPI00083644D5|nr:TAXI family TRAP transporter solute-binding subunit [Murdochiella massiliensis]
MKKTLSILLTLALAISLTACGGGDKPAESKPAESAGTESSMEESKAAPTGEAVNWNFATGGSTGTYYAYGGVIANVFSEKVPNVKLTVQSTGASKANIFSLDDNEAQIGFVQNDVMDYAMKGESLFKEDGAITSFSAVAALYPETCQIVGAKGLTSVADLKGKNVSVGDAGSGVEFNATQILAAYGIDINKDITKHNLSFGDSAEALKDGKIDAFFCVAGAPTTAITELATTNDISILSVDQEHADQLKKDFPFYSDISIPANTYKGVDADVQTVAVKATIICRNDLPEDAVYNLVKGIFDNKDMIGESHAKGKLLDPNYAVEAISVPFHPGAEKYFKEIGVMK